MRLTPDLLLRAYAAGIFPMAEGRDDPELFWVDPDQRGILPLDGFHLPKRLKRSLRTASYCVTVDTAFRRTVAACAAPRPGSPDSWINEEIRRLYAALFDRGHAHSVECWQGDDLVGGLYGVSLGGAFFGESMFSTARDASKIALVYLVAQLRAGGFTLLDTQFKTDHLAQFGVIEIPRPEYRRRLDEALSVQAVFGRIALGQAQSLEDVIHYAGC